MRSEEFEANLARARELGRELARLRPMQTNAEMNRELEVALLDGFLEGKKKVTGRGDFWWVP